jgi:hypothetical protein
MVANSGREFNRVNGNSVTPDLIGRISSVVGQTVHGSGNKAARVIVIPSPYIRKNGKRLQYFEALIVQAPSFKFQVQGPNSKWWMEWRRDPPCVKGMTKQS